MVNAFPEAISKRKTRIMVICEFNSILDSRCHICSNVFVNLFLQSSWISHVHSSWNRMTDFSSTVFSGFFWHLLHVFWSLSLLSSDIYTWFSLIFINMCPAISPSSCWLNLWWSQFDTLNFRLTALLWFNEPKFVLMISDYRCQEFSESIFFCL